MVHALTLGLGLSGLWLLLSGHYDPLLLSLGAASVVTVVLIAWRMDVVDHECVPLQLRLGYFGYLLWLGMEIIKANIEVTKVILNPSLPITPELFWIRASQKTDVGRVIHANSITLTPGTVSVEVEGGSILVHAITAELADGTRSGEMDRYVTRVEGG